MEKGNNLKEDIMGTILIGELLAKDPKLSERQRREITRRRDTRTTDGYLNRYLDIQLENKELPEVKKNKRTGTRK